MKVDKREVPSLYWKVFKLLEKHELDDAHLSAKVAASRRAAYTASNLRLTKREARKVEKELEQWFGKKPNGEDKNARR